MFRGRNDIFSRSVGGINYPILRSSHLTQSLVHLYTVNPYIVFKPWLIENLGGSLKVVMSFAAKMVFPQWNSPVVEIQSRAMIKSSMLQIS